MLLIALALSLSCAARCQHADVPDVPDLARQLALGRNLYTLGHTYADPRFSPKSPAEAAAIIGEAIDSPAVRESGEEIKFLKAYQKQIDSLLHLLPTVAEKTDSKYVCDGFLTPVRIARRDSSLCVVFTGLASNDVFDAYSHTARERAQTVMESMLLPRMKVLGRFAKEASLGYIGAALYYPTSASDTVADVPEMLMMVAPADECIKFSREEITEDELLSVSDVFLADIDTPSDVRKIKLELK